MVISINKIGGKSEQGKYKKPNKEPKKKSVIILGDSMVKPPNSRAMSKR